MGPACESAPEECPICHAPASKFAEQSAEKTWAAEHVVGIAKGVRCYRKVAYTVITAG